MPASETASVIAAIAGSVSAIGTLAAAAIAYRSVRLSSRTTRRNNEATARANRPTLKADIPRPTTDVLPDPTELTVVVTNSGNVHQARNIRIELVREDGTNFEPVRLDPIPALSPKDYKTLTTPPIPKPYGPKEVRAGDTHNVLSVRVYFEDDARTLEWCATLGLLQADNLNVREWGQRVTLHAYREARFDPIEVGPAWDFARESPGPYRVRLRLAGSAFWRSVVELARALTNRPKKPQRTPDR